MSARRLAPGIGIGEFVLVSLLGAGATATVFIAEHEGRRVALKVLNENAARDPRVRAAFLAEARRAADLRHPNVVPLIASGETDGRVYIASRLVEGGDLRRAAADAGGRLAPNRVYGIARQVAAALDAAHADGLVHRDVKPANILLETAAGGEQAYVCDFGVARDVAGSDDIEGDGLVGTLAFMAPEQIRGEDASGAADQYGLACVVFACLAGRPPFVRDSELAVAYAHLEEAPPRLTAACPELPAGVDDVFARALAKGPADRFTSCGEFVNALGRALRGKPVASRRRRHAFVVVGVVGVLAAGSVLAAALFGGGQGLRPEGVAVLDPGGGSLHSIAAGGFISDMVHLPDDRLLALQPFDRRILVLDPARHRVERSLSLGIDPGGAPAFAAGRIWVSDPSERALLRIQPEYDAVDRIPLPRSGLADPSEAGNTLFAFGSLWVPDGKSMVERIDPVSGTVVRRIRVSGALFAVAGERQLWILSPDLGSAFRIDPSTNRVVARADIHPPLMAGAVAGGYLWVSIGPDGEVWKISRKGRVLGAVKTGADAESLTGTATEVWVTNTADFSITRIDAATNATRTYRFRIQPNAIALVDGKVIFGTGTPPTLGSLPPSGPRVVRMLFTQDWISNADPALADSEAASAPAVDQLFYATCAKLYNYRDVSGPSGAVPFPEVAAEPPQLSADRRVVRIRVRSGFRFSPPSREAVDARTFAHVLERDLAPGTQAPDALPLLGDIVGARAFQSGSTARLSGLSATRTTLTIRLRRPVADLVERLASPLGCAVPKATPAANSPNGLGPIPMAGPYYLARYDPGADAVLRRNPNYAGPRHAQLDAIVYELAVPGTDAVKRVAGGTADLFDDIWPFPYAKALLPPNGPPSGTRRFRPSQLGSRFLLVTPRRGPLAAPALRRAVDLALDRRALAALWASPPASSIIPAPLLGSARFGFARRRNVEVAQRLVAGRDVRVTLVSCRIPAPTCADTAALVRSQLASVRIQTRVLLEDDPPAFVTRADLLLGTWGLRWASPADARPVLAGSVPDAVDVYARTAYAELVSRRLGCLVHNPVFPLLDLAALCMRS